MPEGMIMIMSQSRVCFECLLPPLQYIHAAQSKPHDRIRLTVSVHSTHLNTNPLFPTLLCLPAPQDLVELVNIVQSHESSAEMKALLSGGSSPTTPRPQTLLHQRSLAMASSRRASQTLQIAVFIADNGPVSVTALVLAKALARWVATGPHPARRSMFANVRVQIIAVLKVEVAWAATQSWSHVTRCQRNTRQEETCKEQGWEAQRQPREVEQQQPPTWRSSC